MTALAFKAAKEWRTTDALVLGEASRLGPSAMAEAAGNGALERPVFDSGGRRI